MQVTGINTQLKESHKTLDKIAETLANSAKWHVASSAINGVTRSIEQAWGYTKALDSSLNDIRIVTGKSAEEMANFAVQANDAAKSLGKTTTDYTNAALIYAQQGLSDADIEERAKITLKAANVTGQSTDEVSEQLTAVWNGYKVTAEEAELYVDRLAAVAAKSASDLEELSTGMSKVASAAAAMGVGEDKLAAQLATIISVTRQAPESVGTALRTIYARISDIQAGMDEEGVTLGRYSGKMASMGINVLDVNNKLRDMGDVMEEIGAKWDTMTREQQVYLAQTMAGQRQYNNLLALFDNFE
jgi:TP901 family phage tail tape measure protein